MTRPDRCSCIRRRYVGRGMREDIVIRNYGHETIAAVIALLVDVDFADLFLVKSGETGSGARLTPRVRGRELEFRQAEGRASRIGDPVIRRGAGMGDRPGRLADRDPARWHLDDMLPAHPHGRRGARGAPLPLRRGTRESGTGAALRQLAGRDAPGPFRPRAARAILQPLAARSGFVAHVRSRASRASGHRGRGALVHDTVRT